MRSSLSALAVFVAIAPALAGDLTPPPGPITETATLMEEVEPRTPIGADTTPGDATALYVISLPGSYYLAGNVTGMAGKHGIRIDASGVTIDLNGFSLAGGAGSLTGITCDPDLAGDIVILNGSLSAWDEWAVDLTYSQSFPLPHPRNTRLDRLRAVRNGHGMRATGAGTEMTDCIAMENDGFGLIGGSGVRFVRCQALSNLGGTGNASGINGGYGAALIDCAAIGNGDHGMSVGFASSISNCISGSNGLVGFNLEIQSTATGSVALDNGSYGFHMKSESSATDCRASGNGQGYLLAGDRSRLTRCLAATNLGPGVARFGNNGNDVSMEDCDVVDNSGAGVTLGRAADLRHCAARGNSGDGFNVGEDAQLNDCMSIDNSGDGAQLGAGGAVRGSTFNGNANGLVIDDATLVERCVIRGNAGYGILAEDTTANEDDGQCRIDGNVIDTNATAGVYIEDQALITNNTIALNGQAGGVNGGIVIGSSGSRIDSNAFTQNTGAGLRLLANRNVVVRNTFMLNTSHVIDVLGTNQVAPFGSVATAGAWDNVAH